ncbi:AAA family ATPase [Sphingobium sp. TKS]|uniref:AAA family ATPase n=1 Tax=Sphingobium sp. TKS TaxID=1315974 RepID=UPI0007700C32|nr:ATP-binding protein [Sphingobium sp. TKS]AMK24369.1 AAA ATPase [Sphingobium sp. TKS]
MELTFQKTHLSITSFPTINVPDFTLITGPNGAGKSHLLQAITNGCIRSNIAQPHTPGQEIRLFDWNTLVPQDTGVFSSENLRNEREGARTNFINWRQHHQAAEPLRAIGRQLNLPAEFIDNPVKLAAVSRTELQALIPEHGDVASVMDEISGATEAASQWILQQADDNTKATLMAVSASAKRPLILLEAKDIEASGIPNWGRSDLFQQSFARLFVAYRDARLTNLLAEFEASRGHSTTEYLTEADFIEKNGPPPWDFVNQTVQSAGLDFTINSPRLHDFSPYTPQLTKNSSGAIIPFSSLSSGEKILMSFAFCVYYANDRRQLAVYPKIILFDEIDAPLHPSMTRSLVDTITGTLVRQFGIKVMATTHSPSTVAMAPPEAMFIMRPGKAGLQHITKSEALNILTFGVPTLAISFDGRRQVFVESPADAKTYDAIYKLIKNRIVSERSLEFVATGGLTNVGCDVVKRLVASLVEAGNQSIFGLIDYDGHHVSTNRIAVLGQCERNGLENFVFDPLLIAALICRDSSTQKGDIGIDESIGYPAFIEKEPATLQVVVDAVCEKVFGEAATQQAVVEYWGGFSLSLDKRWLEEDDHALESKILTAFPYLQALSKQQAGKLMQHMISSVISDKPGLIPLMLVETIRDLLDRDAHI